MSNKAAAQNPYPGWSDNSRKVRQVANMTCVRYGDFDPGIRETVRWLRDHGFETCDSGDGVSKANKLKDGQYLPFPHVVMLSTPGNLVADAERLQAALAKHGIGFEARDFDTDPHIEASYSPLDGHAVIMLSNVDDKSMGFD